MYVAESETATQAAKLQKGERKKAILHVKKTGEIYRPILEKWASNAKVVSTARSHKRGD